MEKENKNRNTEHTCLSLQTSTQNKNIDMLRKKLSYKYIFSSLEKHFYNFFNDFIHVYSLRAGADGDKNFMSTEMPYDFVHLLQV